MHGRVKLTKRQIKEDKFTAFMLESKERVAENWQYYLVGVVAVVVIIAGAIYYTGSQDTARVAGAAKYAEAVSAYRSGDMQVAQLSLSQITSDYGGQVAEQAQFLLATVYFDQRNYAEAIANWETYLSKYRNNKLNRASAAAGIAASHENQAQFQEAADWYVRAIDEYPDGPIVGDYHHGAMRCFLALGQVEQAQQQLDIISEKFEGTELVNRSKRLFAEETHG